MIIKKIHSYARPSLITRVCPVCEFKQCEGEEYGSKFIKLETLCNLDNGNRSRLYACPKCGTIGIDVEED